MSKAQSELCKTYTNHLNRQIKENRRGSTVVKTNNKGSSPITWSEIKK